jgi:hypothetical protein
MEEVSFLLLSNSERFWDVADSWFQDDGGNFGGGMFPSNHISMEAAWKQPELRSLSQSNKQEANISWFRWRWLVFPSCANVLNFSRLLTV